MKFTINQFNRWLAKPKDIRNCWEWPGSKDNRDYGKIYGQAKTNTKLAHKAVFELFNGKVPKGLELDHLCRNHACVNPYHLEAVTHQENVRRGEAGNHFSLRTHCLRGHAFTEENTRWEGTKRRCKTCVRQHSLAWYHRQANLGIK